MAAFFSPIVPIEKMQKASFGQMITGGTQLSEKPTGFGDVLSQAMQQVEQAQETSRQDAVALELGDVDNLAQIQINSMKSATMPNCNTANQPGSKCLQRNHANAGLTQLDR